MMKQLAKFILIFIILGIVIIKFFSDDIILIINENIEYIKNIQSKDPYFVETIFFIVYIIMTSLSLPVALMLGILSGILFDPINAIIIISLASSIGASFALIISRYFFRDYLLERYKDQYETINHGFMQHGGYYLFALRMVPLFPYFIINFISGLTTIRVNIFFIVSLLGMLPMTIIIIMIGNNLGEIILNDASVNFNLIILLSIFGLLPLTSKIFFKKYFG